MLALSDSDFQRLYTYIKKNYGIDLSKKKQLIISRLSNSLSAQGYQDFSTYVDEIVSGRDTEMVTAMLNKLTTNYTYFLREEEPALHIANTLSFACFFAKSGRITSQRYLKCSSSLRK